MSFDVNWDINKYREDHESNEQWLLRQNFMERWKQNYPEERLVCLARVFANIEFMGCRYPKEVMLEVATMSKEVNKNVTYNNKKLPSFDVGRSLAHDETTTFNPNITGSQGSLSTSNQNYTTYFDRASNSTDDCDYIRRDYSTDVTQGPKLQTHSKSFNPNSPVQNLLGNLTWRKLLENDSQQPNMSDFIDNTYSAGTENPSSNLLWQRREPKVVSGQDSNVNTEILQRDEIQSINRTTNQEILSANDKKLPISQPTVENTQISAHDVDMRLGNPTEASQNEAIANFDGNPHDIDMRFGNGVPKDPNMSNNDDKSIKDLNTKPDSSSTLASCSEDKAMFGKDQAVNPLEQNLGMSPVAIYYKNSSQNNARKKRKPTVKVQKLSGPGKKRRYHYWLHVGKTEKEARELCQIKLNKIPEYKQTKATMGSSKQYSKSYYKYVTKHWPDGRVPGTAFSDFQKIYVPRKKKQITDINIENLKNTVAHNIKSAKTHTDINLKKFKRNTVARNVKSRLRSATTDSNTNVNNAVAGTSNIGATTSKPVAAVNTGATVNTEVANKLCTSLDTTDTDAVKNANIDYLSRLRYWISMGKTKTQAKILSKQPLGNKRVKQLKAISTDTINKLANKEQFKQIIKARTPPKITINDSQLKHDKINDDDIIEISDVIIKPIEISDEEIEISDEKESSSSTDACIRKAAKPKIAKEVQEKRRIWWMQNGKTEEEAAILCQTAMAISDALEKIPDHKAVIDKERHDKNFLFKTREAQRAPIIDTNQAENLIIPELGTLGSYNEDDNTSDLSLDENTFKSNQPTIATLQPHTSLTMPKPKPCGSPSKPKLGKKATKNAINTGQFRIFVKDVNKEFYKKDIVALRNAITKCISDNDEIRFLSLNKKHGCAVITCGDEQSRDWFDKEIPTLEPYSGAQLEIIDEIQIPNYVYAWIYLPIIPQSGPLSKPGASLSKLHKQNPGVGCDKWIVLHAQMQNEGHLLFVRFEENATKILKTMSYKLNWYNSRPVKVRIKKNVPKKTKLTINMQNQKILANSSRRERKMLRKNPRSYEDLVNNLRNLKTNKSVPLISISDDECTLIQQEEVGDKIPHINTPTHTEAVTLGPSISRERTIIPIESRYSEMLSTDSYAYPKQVIPKQHSPLLIKKNLISSHSPTNHQTASDINAEISHSKDLTASYSSVERVTQSNQATPLAMNKGNSVSSQLEDTSQQVSLEYQIHQGKLPSNGSSAVIYSKIYNPEFWGIDTPCLLPAHREAIAVKTDLRENDPLVRIATKRKADHFNQRGNDGNAKHKDSFRVGIFAGLDEKDSIEERVFTARKRAYSRAVRVTDEREKTQSKDRDFTERDIGNIQEVVTERCTEYNWEDRVRDQNYLRENRVIAERDQEYTQENGVAYPLGENAFTAISQDNNSEKEVYSRENRRIYEPVQEYSRPQREFYEREREHSRQERDYHRDLDFQEEREFTDNNSEGQAYSRGNREFNDRGQEYSRSQKERGERNRDHSRQVRDYHRDSWKERADEGFTRKRRNSNEQDEEYPWKSRDLAGRVNEYSKEERGAGHDDRNYSRTGRVSYTRNQDFLQVDTGFEEPEPKRSRGVDRRDQDINQHIRDSRDRYQTRDRSPNHFRTVFEDRMDTRREADSNHFGRSDERIIFWSQDTRRNTSDRTSRRGQPSRGREYSQPQRSRYRF